MIVTSTDGLVIVDLFCGAGGATTAALRAIAALLLKVKTFFAFNHWRVAMDTLEANYPMVTPGCEDIETINPREKVPGGRVHLLIAAPECTFFSTARGGRPVNDQQRTQPWVVLKWLQELYVENLLIENVPEFRQWGPIGANGKPLKSKKGQTFRAFIEAIRALDYTVDVRVLNAADYGDPTTRKRLFIIARRGKKPVAWPTPTHSRDGGRSLFGRTERWRPARDVIDWSIPGQSIFGRKRPLSPKTVARIVAGLDRFGGEELKPFLIVLRNNADARSLDKPLATISAQGQHHGLVQPFVMPVTHGSDGSKRERSVEEPLPTITGAHRGELAVCEPFIVPNNENNVPKSVDAPLPTVTTGDRLYLAEPMILQQQSGGVARPVDQPLPTIATDGAQMLVEPFLVQPCHGGDDARRVKSLDDPIGTLPCSNRFAVVEPFLIPHFGERPTQAPRTHSVDEPVPTIAATGQIDVVQPFLVSAGGPRVGPLTTEEPLNTVLTRDHMAVVQPFILGQQSNSAPRLTDDPLPTIATGGKIALAEPIIASYYGTQNVSPVSDPLPTVTTKDRFALVMPVVNGRALDIKLRMLKPHELSAAHSFGDGYTFTGNQGDQVKQIGNSWPCRLGQALIQTILEPYAVKRKPRGNVKTEAIA